MADEAFALSPISARAAQPSEEDYDAISKAFMETSRGRWFLGEYAKRNRNADTNMVLEAVARLEENLAAQRQPEPAPVPDNSLAEALAAIRGAVDAARVAALDGLALEEKLAPVRKGSRIIREIAWRWREIGADGRICDLIDSQIGAIEEACGQIASINPLTAFDVIERQLAELGGSEISPAAPHMPREDGPSTAAPPAPSDEMLAALAEPLEAEAPETRAPEITAPETRARETTAPEITASQTSTPAAPAADRSAATVEAASVLAEAAIAASEAMEVTAENAVAADETTASVAETAPVTADPVQAVAQTEDAVAAPLQQVDEAAEAHDEAILDMIALEMAADDPADFDDIAAAAPAEMTVAEAIPAAPINVAREPEPVTAAPHPAPVEPSLQPAVQADEEPSLGSSLISRGILTRPAAATDPLAPIRRMSQAEKIAFFS